MFMLKARIKKELNSITKYLCNNWVGIVLSIAIGALLIWLIKVLDTRIPTAEYLSFVIFPPFWLSVVVMYVFLIALYQKTVSFFLRYRNSYFLSEPHFLAVDFFILALLPALVYFAYLLLDITAQSTILIASAVLFFVAEYFHAVSKSIKTMAFTNAQDERSQASTLFSDEPISRDEEDLVGRKRFAEALKEHIYNLSFVNSFVIALYGRWGEGKTSILNLFKKEVKNDGKILIYEFDPWFFGDENAIVGNFYRGLEDLLQENYFIPRDTKKYLTLYPEILIKGFVGLSFNFHRKESEDRPMEIKKKIEQFVSAMDKRVLVVIDNIDRLQREEVLAVFRLVKLTSQMKNMVFLLSFDPSRVAETIKDTERDPYDYIEKIVQLPIHLPMTEQRKIDRFLLFSYPDVGYRSEIDKLFDRLGVEGKRRKDFDEAFVKIYNSELKQLFSTFRAAKRYLNSIIFRLPFVEREVNLYDFFMVEVLQTFFPAIYADLKNSPWYYASHWSFEFTLSPLSYNENKRREEIKQHLDNLLIDEKEKTIVISLLEDIFPEVKNAVSRNQANYDGLAASYRIEKRIAHPECYMKYLMLDVREGIIPDKEFEDILKQWSESLVKEEDIASTFFEKYKKESKLIDLLQRLKLHAGSLDKETALALIGAIYKNCSRFTREGDMWNTEFDQSEGVIFRILEDNQSIKKEEIQGVLKEVIENMKCFDYASMVLLTCRKERGGSLHRVYENIKYEDLTDILEKRLKKHFIEDKNDVFEEYPQVREYAFILYQWATRWGDKEKTNKDLVTDYLIGLIEKKPSYAGYFLVYEVKKGLGFHEDQKYFDYSSFVAGYDVDKYTQKLVELGGRAYSTESEKEAIELLLNAHKKAQDEKNKLAQNNTEKTP